MPPLALKADGDSLKLGFPDGWLGGHPLTRADLESEAGYLKAAGIKLKIK